MAVSMAMSTPLGLSASSKSINSSTLFSTTTHRNSIRLAGSGLSIRTDSFSLKLDKEFGRPNASSHGAIEARENPPLMPAIMTQGGPLDLTSVLLRNRTIFIGQPISSEVAQQVIAQLITLATIDENSDILIYINCPGGSIYSIMAIYDCMCWIKPKVGTICFGIVASQAAVLLAGGEKGMRYSMPNSRIMIHQPQTGFGGETPEVLVQVQEALQNRNRIERLLVAFTGQTRETVQMYIERDHYFSAAEAMDFGIIDGILETKM